MHRVRSILTLLLILFLGSSLTKNILDYQKTVSFYEAFRSEYEVAKKRNVELQTRILKSTDSSEVEKTIRNKLGLQKPGETTLIIPSPTPIALTPTPSTAPTYYQWYQLYREGK